MTWQEMFGNGAVIGIVPIIIRSWLQRVELLEILKARMNRMIRENPQKKNVYIVAVRSFVPINTAHVTWLEPEAKAKLAAPVIMSDSAALQQNDREAL